MLTSNPRRARQGSGGRCLSLGVAGALALLVGCSSGGSSTPPPPKVSSISGEVSGASGVTVELGGLATTSTSTDGSGRYQFGGLPSGTYVVTPHKPGYLLAPARRTIVVSGADVTGASFTATPVYSISGTVSGASQVYVALAGSTAASIVMTDPNGDFRFDGVPAGSYTLTPDRAGHALTPVRRQLVVTSADVSGVDFDAVALTTFDPLTADTLDNLRWQTPEYAATISGGKAALSVRASGMQSNLLQGRTYTNALTVAAGGARVTTLQADVAVPAAGAARSGDATIYGGLRLYYQPAADRLLSSPGGLMNELIAALELFEDGSGLRVRRRFAHCDDDACVGLGAAGLSYLDPAGFSTTGRGVNGLAPAAYDTTYTFSIALDEATGVFTWSVSGGTFGPSGVSGTVAASAWAASVGMNLGSTSDGFLSAQLHARTSDASVAGGGSGAITTTFDDVRVATNGGAAALHDDFSGTGSSAATGFSLARWGATAGGAVEATGGALHLRAGVTAADEAGVSAATRLAAQYVTTVSAWQVDVALVDVDGAASAVAVEVGGSFANDGTAGGDHDATGDLVSRVALRVGDASIWIGRCMTPSCSSLTTLAEQPLATPPSSPLGIGTVHTVFQQWDPATQAFAYRIDTGVPPLVVPTPWAAPAPARVPSRYVRALARVPPGAAAGTSSGVEVTVANVRTAP